MKKRKQILIMVIIFLLIVLLPTITKAGIESKPGTTAWTNISVSDAYGLCYDLNSGGSTLGDCNLDPHLALNKDWGAVAYLAVSGYGAVTTATGPSISIDGMEGYYTTTGNITGVINLGKTAYTYTSGSIAVGLEEDSKNNQYRTNLIKNKDTRYVEILPDAGKETAENTKGMAIVETNGWFGSKSSYGPTTGVAMVVRCQGVLVFYGGYGYDNGRVSASFDGSAQNRFTFRPVIWNIAR